MLIELGDLATWFNSIFSLLLFVVAFWQIRNERNERHKAESERLFAQRRHQAELVAAWIETEIFEDRGQVVCVAVSNQSLQPIYNVIIQGIVLSNDGIPVAGPFPEERSQIAVVPPGKWYTTFPFNYAGMFKRPGIEIAFQDAANRYWLRKTNGELIELKVPPIVYYDIPLPTGWNMLLDTCPKSDNADTHTV
ncbi:MAG: hypothetical protein QXP27_01020 [Candidatus Methanomethyliaceae archaeon]